MHIIFKLMATLQDEFNSCLYHSTSVLQRQLEKLAQYHFRATGLTPGQGFVLMTVHQAPGISIGDLALVHQLDQSAITRIVAGLVNERFVIREPFGKTSRIFITDLGMGKEADARAAWKKMQHAYTRVLGAEHCREMADRTTDSLKQLRSVRL